MYRRAFFFLFLSLIIFSEKSHSQPNPYCCCDTSLKTNCVAGDNQCCATRSEHPYPQLNCSGNVSTSGDIEDCQNLPYCCCAVDANPTPTQCVNGDNLCCITQYPHFPYPSFTWGDGHTCVGVASSGNFSTCEGITRASPHGKVGKAKVKEKALKQQKSVKQKDGKK